MADMDLREVLAERISSAVDGWKEDADGPLGPYIAFMVTARLSQPDVLDEFERRCQARKRAFLAQTFSSETTTYFTLARKALADMLGGES